MSEQMSDQEWLVRLQFLEEAQEYLDTIESALLGLGEQKLTREAIDGILRAAHSIKGGAALMGFHELSQVAHRLEDFFKVLQGGRYEPEGELERLFLSAVDRMSQMLELYRERSGIDAGWLEANTQPLLDQLYDRLGDPTAADEQASLAADAGGDMGVMLFESEIGPCLDRLEGAIQDPDLPLLRQEFLIACAEMGSLGEMLEISPFIALCNHGLQLCTDCPESDLVEVCQAVLKPLRRSHGLVLVGQAGLIPETVLLPQAIKAAITSTQETDQPGKNADTTSLAESSETPTPAPQIQDLFPEDLGESIEPSNFSGLADCLDTESSLADLLNLGGLVDTQPPESQSPESPSPQHNTTHDSAPTATTPTPEISVEAIASADEAVLDSLFEGMTPEDFSLEAIALAPAAAVISPEADEVITDNLPLEESPAFSSTEQPDLQQANGNDLEAPQASSEPGTRPKIEPSPLPASATDLPSEAESSEPTALDAETLVSIFLNDEAFDLEELADFNSTNPTTAEPPQEPGVNHNAIAQEAAQLTSSILTESEADNSSTDEHDNSSTTGQDTSIRVSVRKLERLGELLGELTTDRNGLGIQLGYLSTLFGLLNQRVKSLDQANNILRQSYDRGATQQLSNTHNNSTPANPSTTPPPSTPIPSTQSLSNSFDLLEMDQYSELHLVSQEIIDSVVQIQEVTSDIELALGETETVSRSLNRTAQQLQVGMNQMRMRPLSAITDRFPRLLRELSMAHDKQVDLQVRGSNTLIERTIIEALQDPLMHLLRNCFDHGIEDRETRITQGKTPQGNIEIGASYRGNQVAITIQDDGAGINLEKIRSKVLSMGLTPAEIEVSGDKELVNLIFEPGFSTAEQVTSLSGRGVGMDVVRSNLRDIQGDITVETKTGQGSTFTLTVPLSLSVTRVLVVECQGMVMAFPANIVEEMLLLEQQKIVQAAEQDLLEWQGYTVPLLRLQNWLHFVRPLIKLETESSPIIDQSSALIVTHGDEPYAIECDRYWGEQEVTTRTVEGKISLPQGFSGCVVLGDGRVVPLVEMEKLMSWVLRDAQRQDLHEQNLALPIAISNKRTVLVIDDSINVRRFLSITLEKAGYHVEQAKDGQDAIDQLQSGITADVIMSDVEMPRLDGFGFLAQVKSLPNCEDIPVVMLTSRSGDKHRQLAMSLGAADYFSKPFKQTQLLQSLEQLIELSASFGNSQALPELAIV